MHSLIFVSEHESTGGEPVVSVDKITDEKKEEGEYEIMPSMMPTYEPNTEAETEGMTNENAQL
jgi:hypothetical protein